ncbi:MAG: glycosyl transferase [Bacteroidota bacterium]
MNCLYSIYFALPDFTKTGIIGKIVVRLQERILKRIFDRIMPAYFRRTANQAGSGINSELRDEKYIVSLTSFPARIDDIWISIETILRQSFKPDMIILWLAEEQFPDKKLPESLRKLEKRGLTIQYCDDLRSHKKYYYAFKNYPDANIITLDDDLYYHRDVLKNVAELHRKYPGLICTNRAHKFTFRNGLLNPYRKWKFNVTDALPSHLLVQTGGAGTLYPPGSLSDQAFDKKLIRELCLHADDLWLKAMALKEKTLVVTNAKYNKDFLTIASTQRVKLVTTNVFDGGNDKQFKDVCEYFSINLNSIEYAYRPKETDFK